MAAIGAVPRAHKNREFGYHYRSIDDLLNALQPALVELGITQVVRVKDCRITSRTESKPGGKQRENIHAQVILEVGFHASDGSAVWYGGVGEAIDYGGDKASTKALVMAYKYAVTLGLAIPVANLVDGDVSEAASAGETSSSPATIPISPDLVSGPMPAEILDTALPTFPPGQLYSAPPLNPYSVGQDDLCLNAQVDEIKRLAASLQPVLDAQNLKAIVQRRGAQTLAQLTVGQAQEIINKLKDRRLAQEAASVF